MVQINEKDQEETILVALSELVEQIREGSAKGFDLNTIKNIMGTFLAQSEHERNRNIANEVLYELESIL